MPPRRIITATSPPNTWSRYGFSDVSNRPSVDSGPGRRERASGAGVLVRAGVDRYLQVADAGPCAAIRRRGMRGGGGVLWAEHVSICSGACGAFHLGGIGRTG